MAGNSLDAKTRAIEKMQVTGANQMEAYQAAQNQLLAIKSEQKQNLAMARAQSAATTQENNLIGQVAGLVDAGGGTEIVQTPVNAATQGVLGKYGMGPTISKTTQRQTQSVTKQNVTINNYTTTNNTTTNNVAGGGPMQGRPLVVNRDNNSAGRFKVWVQNVIARQNEQAAIRDKEYERRESELTRSANKMTRKLEGISSNIAKSLDPRRLNQTVKDSLSTILKMIGFGMVVTNFPKIVESAINLEKKFTNLLDYIGITGRDARAASGEDSRLVKDLKYFLGGDPESGKNVTLFSTIGKLFTGDSKRDGIIGLIRKEFELMLEHRGKALEKLQGPDISWWKDSPGTVVAKLGDYLKNVFKVMLSGDDVVHRAASIAAEKESKQAMMDPGSGNKAFSMKMTKTFVDENNKKVTKGVSYGDLIRIGEKGHSSLLSQDVDKEGNLTSIGAALTQSRYIGHNIVAKDENLNFRGILEGLNRLEKSAGEGVTVVDKSFLNALESIGVDVSKMREQQESFKIIPIKKNDLQRKAEESVNKPLENWTKILAGRGGKALADPLLNLRYEDYAFVLVPANDPNYKNYKGEVMKGFTDDKGVFKLPVLSKADFENINSQLGNLTGHENFSVDDLSSTAAFADYMMKKFPNRSISENEKIALEGSKEDEEYRRKQRELYDDSYLALSANRIAASSGRTLEKIENKITVDPKYGIFYRKKNNPNLPFNVDRAIKWLEDHDKGSSTGYCARHVALGVEAGFGNIFSDQTAIGSLGWGQFAKDEGGYLHYLGFEPIDNNSVPQRGDIKVLQPKDPGEAGHIEMYSGSDWFSDFKQKGSLSRLNKYSSYQLYRYAGPTIQGIEGNDGDIVPESAYSTSNIEYEPTSSASVIAQNSNNGTSSFTTSWGTYTPEETYSFNLGGTAQNQTPLIASTSNAASSTTSANISSAVPSSTSPSASVLSTVSISNKVNELTRATVSGNQSLNDSLNTLIQINNIVAKAISANVDATNTVAQAVTNLVPLLQNNATPPKTANAAPKTT